MDGNEHMLNSGASPGGCSVAASDGSDQASASSPEKHYGTAHQPVHHAWLAAEQGALRAAPGPGPQQFTLSMLGAAVLSPRDPQAASRAQATFSSGPENQPPVDHEASTQHQQHLRVQQQQQPEPSKQPLGADPGVVISPVHGVNSRTPSTYRSQDVAVADPAALVITPRSCNSVAAAPAETDLAFGPHRITVHGPAMSHQRIDLYSDGTVLTMSQPASADHYSPRQGDQVHLMVGNTTPSGKSVVSSSPAPASVSSPNPARTSNADLPPLAGPSPAGVPWATASPGGPSQVSSPNPFSTPVVHVRPTWFAQSEHTVVQSAPRNSFAPAVHQGAALAPATHIGQPLLSPGGPTIMDVSPRSYAPAAHGASPYGAAPYSGTPQYGCAMATPMGPSPWVSGAQAAMPGTAAQAFGSEQANSPPDAGSLFPSPYAGLQQRGRAPPHFWGPPHRMPPVPPNPTNDSMGVPSSSFDTAGRAAFPHTAGTGTGGSGASGGPVRDRAGAGPAVSPMASSTQIQSGTGTGPAVSGPSGDSSGVSPGELRSKYKKTKQLLQTYVKEIETLRNQLLSEGRRAGVLGAQVAALQGQKELAGDSVALLAATQAEKMVVVQKLREAQQMSESLQSQLSIAQAQVRALEQQQGGMLNEFATERQRREAQFMEERQKLEAARAEEESQKMAYLAAFHEDRERWEAAAMEQQRAFKAEYEDKIAAATKEHQCQMAAASAQHEAALQEARAQAQATAEAANALVQRAKAQAQAAAEAAEAAVLEAKVQLQCVEATAAKQAKAQSQAALEAAEAAVQKAKRESQAAAAVAEAEVQQARAAVRAEAEARDAALGEVRRQHAEEMEALSRRYSAELEEVRARHGAELEQTRAKAAAALQEERGRHAAEVDLLRARHEADMGAARGKHAAELEELRGRHAKQLAESEDVLIRRTTELGELRARLAEANGRCSEAASDAAAKAAQLQALDSQLRDLRSAVKDRDSQLLDAKATLAAAESAGASAQQESALQLQARSLEIERLQRALEEAREATRRAMEMASDNATRLAAAEAQLEEAPRRAQERVEMALRKAQEEHRQQLSGAVHRVQHDAAQQLLEIQQSANVANDALSGEMEAQLEAARREVDRLTALLDARGTEVRSLRSSLDHTSQERDKLMAAAGDLQDMVIKLQQRMEKQDKRHAKALEKAQAHREQQVARLQEELEAIRASVPGRVEGALQSYAAQLAANHQAAVAAVEARASAALAGERAAVERAEAALKRAREEAEEGVRQRLAQAEETRRRLEARVEAAEETARARGRDLEAAAARAAEAEGLLRARLAEAERLGDERRAAVQELERQLQEARRQADSARSRAEQLQGVFSVLGQLGLPPHTLEAVAAAAAAAAAADGVPTTSPAWSPWLHKSAVAATPGLLAAQPQHGASSTAAAVAAAAAMTAAAAAATAGQNAACSLPAMLSGLRTQLAEALLPQRQHQQPQTQTPQPRQLGAISPVSMDANRGDANATEEVLALRRRLQEARAEVLMYRRKLEDGVARARVREPRGGRLHGQAGGDGEAAGRSGRQGRSRSVGRGRSQGSGLRADIGEGSGSDWDVGPRGGLDSVMDLNLDLDADLGLEYDQRQPQRSLNSRGRRPSLTPGIYRQHETDLESCSYSEDDVDVSGSRAMNGGRRRWRDSARSCGSGFGSPGPRTGRRGRTPGGRDGDGARSAERRAMAAAEAVAAGDAAAEGLRLRVQQLALEVRGARAREVRCLEAARRADAVILLLHGAASRAQLLLAGAPRQQDQALADELADALARALRHRQQIAQLTVEAEAQGLAPLSGAGGGGGGGDAATAGLQDPLRLKEWETQQALAAALESQLAAAKEDTAAAAKAAEALRSQLLQQAEAHAAEVAAARGAAESAMAQVAHLSAQLVGACAQQQALQQEAQGLRRRLRGMGQQVRQFMDDLRQEVDLADLNNLAHAVITATERAFGLWTIREHDHVQATRRAIAGLRADAAECRQLLLSLAAAQLQTTSQLAARCRSAAADLARLREQGAQDVAAVRRRFEEEVRQLSEEREQLVTRAAALQADKERIEGLVASLRLQLAEAQHAVEEERRTRVEAEERMQAVVAQAVRVAEAQRDAAQAAAVAAAERALNAVGQRDKEAAQRWADMEERLRQQHERDAAQLHDQQLRHAEALRELHDAHEASARVAAEQLAAASRHTQILQERLERQEGQLRRQEEELEGLRAVLRDAEEQLQGTLAELRRAQQAVEDAEAGRAEALRQLEGAEAGRAEATAAAEAAQNEATQLLVEARAQQHAAEEAARQLAEAEQRLTSAEAARDEAARAVAEARAAQSEATEAARSAESEATRQLAEALVARDAAKAEAAAARALQAQLAEAWEEGRQAETRAVAADVDAQTERGVAVQLRQQLAEARDALAEAQEAARVASHEVLQAQDRIGELQLEVLAAERRLDAARAAARLHEQQLAQEQEESDRLRTQLRTCQARVYELQQAAAVDRVGFRRHTSGGGGGGGGGGGDRGSDGGGGKRRSSDGAIGGAWRHSFEGEREMAAGAALAQAAQRAQIGVGCAGRGFLVDGDDGDARPLEASLGDALVPAVLEGRGADPYGSGGGGGGSNGGSNGRSSGGSNGGGGGDVPSGWGSRTESQGSSPATSASGGTQELLGNLFVSGAGIPQAGTASTSRSEPGSPVAAPGRRRAAALGAGTALTRGSVELPLPGPAPGAVAGPIQSDPLPLLTRVTQSAAPPLSPSRPAATNTNTQPDLAAWPQAHPPSPATPLAHTLPAQAAASRETRAPTDQRPSNPTAQPAPAPLDDDTSTQGNRHHLEALLAEVGRHCQRLPAINELLDQMLSGGAGPLGPHRSSSGSDSDSSGSTSYEGIADGNLRASISSGRSGGGSSSSNDSLDAYDGFLRSPAAAAALEHLVSVLGGALQLVAQLEAVVAGAPERPAADVEAALSQHRRQLEGTWARISRARCLVAEAATAAERRRPDALPEEEGYGAMGSHGVSYSDSYSQGSEQDLWLKGSTLRRSVGENKVTELGELQQPPTSSSGAAAAAPPSGEPADDASSFRGFPVPTAAAETTVVATATNSTSGAVALEAAEPSSVSSGGVAALAAARAELARALVSSLGMGPASTTSASPASSPQPLPLPVPVQQPHPAPVQRPEPATERQQRLSLADLVAPRRAGDWTTSVRASGGSVSSAAGDAPTSASPEPQPRAAPPLLPMPLSSAKAADIQQQHQLQQKGHLQPHPDAPTSPPSPAAQRVVPSWLQRLAQPQPRPDTARPLLDQRTASRESGGHHSGTGLAVDLAFLPARAKHGQQPRNGRYGGSGGGYSGSDIGGPSGSGNGGAGAGRYDDLRSSGTSSSSSISLARGDGTVPLQVPAGGARPSGVPAWIRPKPEAEPARASEVVPYSLRSDAAGSPQRMSGCWTDGGSRPPPLGFMDVLRGSSSAPVSLAGLPAGRTDTAGRASSGHAASGLAGLRASFGTMSSYSASSYDLQLGSPPRLSTLDRSPGTPGRPGRYGSPPPRGGGAATTATTTSLWSPGGAMPHGVTKSSTSALEPPNPDAVRASSVSSTGLDVTGRVFGAAGGTAATLLAGSREPHGLSSWTAAATPLSTAAAAATIASPPSASAADQTPTSHPQPRPLRTSISTSTGGTELIPVLIPVPVGQTVPERAADRATSWTLPGYGTGTETAPGTTASATTAMAAGIAAAARANASTSASSNSSSGSVRNENVDVNGTADVTREEEQQQQPTAVGKGGARSGTASGLPCGAAAATAATAAAVDRDPGTVAGVEQPGCTPCSMPGRRHSAGATLAGMHQQHLPHQQQLRGWGSAPGDTTGGATGGAAAAAGQRTEPGGAKGGGGVLRPADSRKGYAAMHLGRLSGGGA